MLSEISLCLYICLAIKICYMRYMNNCQDRVVLRSSMCVLLMQYTLYLSLKQNRIRLIGIFLVLEKYPKLVINEVYFYNIKKVHFLVQSRNWFVVIFKTIKSYYCNKICTWKKLQYHSNVHCATNCIFLFKWPKICDTFLYYINVHGIFF